MEKGKKKRMKRDEEKISSVWGIKREKGDRNTKGKGNK